MGGQQRRTRKKFKKGLPPVSAASRRGQGAKQVRLVHCAGGRGHCEGQTSTVTVRDDLLGHHTHTHTHPEFFCLHEILSSVRRDLLPPSSTPGSEEGPASCLGLLQTPRALDGPASRAPQTQTHSMELDSVVFYRLFVPEWPPKRDRHRGGSMSVECEYQEAFVDDIKYWCKHPCMSPWRIVETRESEREMRRGRVSIRDRPASLTFTVTLESLREEDVGTYGCGIYVPLSRDPTLQVEVSVIPGEPETPALGLLTYLGP